MKKFLLISLFLIIVISLAIYQSPSLQHKINSALPDSIKQMLNVISPSKILNKTAPLYKWKDKKGQWVITDTPPSDKIPYEVLQYNRNANVVPAK